MVSITEDSFGLIQFQTFYPRQSTSLIEYYGVLMKMKYILDQRVQIKKRELTSTFAIKFIAHLI